MSVDEITSLNLLASFENIKRESEEKKNVIYKFIHLEFKIQEIFPLRLVHSFVYWICKFLVKHFLYFKLWVHLPLSLSFFFLNFLRE